jgi:UDP-glucuronate 4-epimerase
MKFLVTGSAGFIGFHLCRRLLAEGHEVTGIDAMVPYYDVRLKEARHALLGRTNAFRAARVDISDMAALRVAVEEARPNIVVHLAAQAGVRYALEHPDTYVAANVVGTFNLLELCRTQEVRHVLLASTSSAYGANDKLPFVETDKADTPLNIYSATKKGTELIAHCYAHLWAMPITTFRFFTVYGPWGRPDMALFKFTAAALEGKTIDVYNHGQMARDFTYIDDLVEAIMRLVPAIPVTGQPVADCDSLSPVAPFRLVNIGNGAPVSLLDFIEAIEQATGKPLARNYLPMQPGEVVKTWAESALLEALTGFRPNTKVRDGVQAFVDWYREYYAV